MAIGAGSYIYDKAGKGKQQSSWCGNRGTFRLEDEGR